MSHIWGKLLGVGALLLLFSAKLSVCLYGEWAAILALSTAAAAAAAACLPLSQHSSAGARSRFSCCLFWTLRTPAADLRKCHSDALTPGSRTASEYWMLMTESVTLTCPQLYGDDEHLGVCHVPADLFFFDIAFYCFSTKTPPNQRLWNLHLLL